MLLLFFLSFFKSLFFNFTLNVQSYKRAIGEVSINVSSVLVMLLHDFYLHLLSVFVQNLRHALHCLLSSRKSHFILGIK